MSSYLVIGSWSGRRKVPVNLIGETADGFEVEVLEAAFLPGRGVLKAGQSTLVPKKIVQVEGRR